MLQDASWPSPSALTTPEQYCFFTIQTIFHDISIWCNISRYFHDIFQALNWSKICVISSKICPGSAYVEIFCDKNAVFCVLRQKWPTLYLFAKKVADLKCKVWCQFITNIWQMRYNSKEEPIRLTHVNTQLNWWIAFVNWSMKGQKWLISCIKKYRDNLWYHDIFWCFQMMQYIAFTIYRDTKRSSLQLTMFSTDISKCWAVLSPNTCSPPVHCYYCSLQPLVDMGSLIKLAFTHLLINNLEHCISLDLLTAALRCNL